jgi:hypothetical protein
VFRAFRRASAIRAASVLTMFCVVLTSLSALVHDESDDALCRIVVVDAHDHSDHRLTAAPSGRTDHEDHCISCHSTSLRPIVADSTAAAPATVAVPLIADLHAPRGTDLLRRAPARAPPPA